MRIPRSKLYRAFRCLDGFSDDQCELLMRRVRLSGLRLALLFAIPVVVFVGSCAFSTPVLGMVMEPPLRSRTAGNLYVVVFLALQFGLPVLLALLVRDVLLRAFLREAIRLRLDRIRCLKCGYLLLGRTPEAGAVRCPECGTLHTLETLGVEADDLMATSDRELLETVPGDP